MLVKSLNDNVAYLQGQFDGCSDFVYKDFKVCGQKAFMMMIDNMVDKVALTDSVMNPLAKAQRPGGLMTSEQLFTWLRDDVLSSIDQKEVFSYEDAITYAMEGFAVFLLDGVDRGIVFGVQGFKFRSIEEPSVEKVIRGSHEGFVEPVRMNMMLIRRRVKNPNLKFEMLSIGSESKTDVCISYIKGIAPDNVISLLKHRLNNINSDMILASGYIESYIEESALTIFPSVGTTERPDSFCGKLNEGRVGIIVDGTPVSLIVPYIFVENFQHLDDYAVGIYYATFTRILKYLSFFISIFAPGLYVAIGSFHQSVLPSELLYALAQSEEATPFPLVLEALIMQLIYEMLREAGLRLPKQIGHAVNIVGALLIGQAAVSAGLIGAPMVIIVALTATTSLVVPSLYEPGVILRFAFILLAGVAGLYGLTIGVIAALFDMCSIKSYGVPYMSPITPLELEAQRDVVFRAPWRILSNKKKMVQSLPGSEIDDNRG